MIYNGILYGDYPWCVVTEQQRKLPFCCTVISSPPRVVLLDDLVADGEVLPVRQVLSSPTYTGNVMIWGVYATAQEARRGADRVAARAVEDLKRLIRQYEEGATRAYKYLKELTDGSAL